MRALNDRTLKLRDLARNAEVLLNVYNLNGELVSTLVNGRLSAGSHESVWQALRQPPYALDAHPQPHPQR